MNRSLTLLATLLAVAVCSFAPTTLAEDKMATDDPFGTIHRLDPALDAILPKDAKLEKLADGFEWSEGPVWIKDGAYLLFSDIPRNQIVRWKHGEGTKVWLTPSGYTGKEPFTGEEPGTNGLMVDAKGRLIMCCHGDRVVAALEKVDPRAKRTVLVEKHEGKRLNSPNDVAIKSNGDMYFTDPPYGLPKRWEDPARELDHCGVYRLSPEGKLTLLTKEMTRPNGIAFSPDEKTLYVAQSDPQAAIWKAFPVTSDGTLGRSRLIHDATDAVGQLPGLPDGMCVDQKGNLFATGPGGVYIFSPQGKLLGRISTGERTANCTFGDDGSSLYITADMYLCRIKTKGKGIGF